MDGLVERQRPGATGDAEVLRDAAGGNFAASPFALLAPKPAEVAPPRRLLGGRLADWCRRPRTRLTMIGAGGFACLLGLFGGTSRRPTGDP